jgi:hypothetical protein
VCVCACGGGGGTCMGACERGGKGKEPVLWSEWIGEYKFMSN